MSSDGSLRLTLNVASKFNELLSLLSYWKTSYVSIKLEVVGCVYLNKDHVEFCDVHTLLLKTQKQAIFKRLNFTRFDYMQCRIKPEKNKVESDGHCTSTLTGSEEVLIIKPTTYFLIPVKFRKVCIRERKF